MSALCQLQKSAAKEKPKPLMFVYFFKQVAAHRQYSTFKWLMP